MGKRKRTFDVSFAINAIPTDPVDTPEVWSLRPSPPDEWWDLRWNLPLADRWVRDADVAIEETSVRHPIDELALRAVDERDKTALEEFGNNPHARRIGLLRWKALAGAVTYGEDSTDILKALGLLETLTTVLSAAFDLLESPRIDPTPMWQFRYAGWEDVTQRRSRGAEYVDSGILQKRLAEALPLVDRSEALSLEMPPADDVLVTAAEIARVVHLSDRSIPRYRKKWGRPVTPHRGRAPAKWRWSQVLPILREQFPEKKFPENSATLRSRLGEK